MADRRTLDGTWTGVGKVPNRLTVDATERGGAVKNGLAAVMPPSVLNLAPAATYDLVVLSHLRWDFVYQRPQHLLTRCARERRVFFVEEPMGYDGPPRMDVSVREDGLHVATPWIQQGLTPEEGETLQQGLLDTLMAEYQIKQYVLWYYTPMAMGFSAHLKPIATVYDCMDELSAFAGASRKLRDHEQELFGRANVVFTGGQSLYESKKTQHHRVFAFPSSVDVQHFAQARQAQPDPADQAAIPHPRIGFFGVIDERLDIDLVRSIAALRPDWHLVMIGPVAKVDPESLPRAANIHYLGGKSYKDLPKYLSGWDVAILPFARNESTRFISPTKTPEYLAAGRPVVSTSIRDVVRPYGEQQLVRIADAPEAFVDAIGAALAEDASLRLRTVDAYLSTISWDRTWSQMRERIQQAIDSRPVAFPLARAATPNAGAVPLSAG